MKVVHFEAWKANTARVTSANPPATQGRPQPVQPAASALLPLYALAMTQAAEYRPRAR